MSDHHDDDNNNQRNDKFGYVILLSLTLFLFMCWAYAANAMFGTPLPKTFEWTKALGEKPGQSLTILLHGIGPGFLEYFTHPNLYVMLLMLWSYGKKWL
jgi:hypothetical protein